MEASRYVRIWAFMTCVRHPEEVHEREEEGEEEAVIVSVSVMLGSPRTVDREQGSGI